MRQGRPPPPSGIHDVSWRSPLLVSSDRRQVRNSARPSRLPYPPTTDRPMLREESGSSTTKAPGTRRPRGFLAVTRSVRAARLRLGAAADHEAVVAVLGHLPPQILVVAERLDRGPHLLVVGVGG